MPREEDKNGFLDLDIDDHREGTRLQDWELRALRSSARDLVQAESGFRKFCMLTFVQVPPEQQ